MPFLYENLNSLYDHYSLSDTLFCTGGGGIDGFFNTRTLPKERERET
jgi:hypothetical protein